jgi:uncharacterized protein
MTLRPLPILGVNAAGDREQEAQGHERTLPSSGRLHLVAARGQQYLFDVESGQLRPLPPAIAHAIGAALKAGDPLRAELVASGLGLLSHPLASPTAPSSVPIRAISLAIAQKCNLGCVYCYAQQGGFGDKPKSMPETVARASVDRLLATAQPGDPVTLAFMGGEPLSNRDTLRAVSHYAAQQAIRRNVPIRFALTTNATLVTKEDIDFFQQFAFTLTVSIDGIGRDHDALRPFAGGRGSFATVATNVRRLLEADQRRFRIFARVTVTPENLDLPATLRGLLAMGFDAVMFAPLLSAPSGKGQMKGADFARLLEQLTMCAELFRSEAADGRLLPFSNVIRVLQRIHDYRREHYPCGAGGGYLAASAEGDIFACHRFVNDDEGYLGDVNQGVSPERQASWLRERNLQNQLPCASCWARYLCSGSCHYEVLKEGRPACDYIRGWADKCLQLYAELMRDRPAMMENILIHE